MSKSSFESYAQKVLEATDISKFVIAYSSDSTITRTGAIESWLRRLRQFSGDKLLPIKVDGANHSMGDQLTLLAQIYMRAFK
ncbi:MAG: hypothetical protein ACREGA_00855 [Candidatus Saccharimonadales bacterium]